MNLRKVIANIIIFGFLSTPLLMWFSWLIEPQRKLNVLVFDKTVLTKKYNDHQSLFWILKHNKYVKSNGKPYNKTKDYLGFFPYLNYKYSIRDFRKSSEKQIDSASNYFNATYYSDTYGIYEKEWYEAPEFTGYSRKIYGGLDNNDYLFLKKMKEKKKLIIGEFNLFASPTPLGIKEKVEDLFGLKSTGWTGRYFLTLDTVDNLELPPWTIRLYKKQYKKDWNFKNSGIVFINENETIAVLEDKISLLDESPVLITFPYGQNKFGVPRKIHYPYWFDITLAKDTMNRIISYYELKVNSTGDSILRRYKIPKIFPATIEYNRDYIFYYFCGDFCDNPVNDNLTSFNGIAFFQLLALNSTEERDRAHFFWKYYRPMMQKILNNYSRNIAI